MIVLHSNGNRGLPEFSSSLLVYCAAIENRMTLFLIFFGGDKSHQKPGD